MNAFVAPKLKFEALWHPKQGLLTSNVNFLPPIPIHDVLLSNPWTYDLLRQPQWLIEQHPYVAFLPKNPYSLMTGPIFGRLNYTEETFPITTIETQAGVRYSLEGSVMASWMRLEGALYDMCERLQRGLRPRNYDYISHLPLPHEYGYRNLYSNPQMARRSAILSRDAFFTMAAMASLLISLWWRPKELSCLPGWARMLYNASYSLLWINDLKNSFVCNPSPGSCVGVFVDPYLKIKVNYLVHFARVGVPFWTVWGPVVQRTHIRDFATFNVLIPPFERELHAKRNPIDIIQQPRLATSSLSYDREPSPFRSCLLDNDNSFASFELNIPPPPAEDNVIGHTSEVVMTKIPRKPMPPPYKDSGQKPGETWQRFFIRRHQENLRYMENETENARENRRKKEVQAEKLDKDDKFPSNSRVFIWTLVDGYYMRELKREKAWVVGSYEVEQRYFDGFRNEFDIHELFHRFSPAEGYEEFESSPEHSDSSCDDAPTVKELISKDSTYVHPVLSYPLFIPDVPRTAELLEKILFSRFGFQAEPRTTYEAIDFNTQDNRAARNSADVTLYLGASVVSWPIVKERSLMDFYNASLESQVHELVTVDWHKPVFMKKIRQLRFNVLVIPALKVKGKGPPPPKEKLFPSYAFSDRVTSWIIAVKDPLTAVEILRNDWLTLDIKDIAKLLLARGSPFSTLKTTPRASLPPLWHYREQLGGRFDDHKFDHVEYAAYVEARKSLLEGPFGPLALKQGGLAWRLAVEVVDPKRVLKGPLSNGLRDSEVVGVVDTVSYFDDGSDRNGWEILCGVYHIAAPLDTEKDRNVHKSWWPLPSAWNKGWRNHGYWTADAEAWYQNRLKDINAGTAKLYNQVKWKEHLKGYTGPTNFREVYSDVATKLLPQGPK